MVWTEPADAISGTVATAAFVNLNYGDNLDIVKVPLNDSGHLSPVDAIELTVASGVITVTQNYYSIDTESDAASDNLDTIIAGTNVVAGHLLIVFANNTARTVVLKDGTGNLDLNGLDVILNSDEIGIPLIYSGSKWRLFSGVNATHGDLIGLADDDHTQYVKADGTRAFSGVIAGVTPVADADLATKLYVDGEIVSDHGDLIGLDDDDHTQYVKADGTRAFSGVIAGVTPVADADLATKLYVDGEFGFAHGALSGLADDDHTQYVKADGTRAFSGVIAGVTPVADADLATKLYVDGEIVSDHGALSGLADDDHTQYVKADGTRAFSGKVSGISPTSDAHLATKGYVDGLSAIKSIQRGTIQMLNTAVSNTATISAVVTAKSVLAWLGLEYADGNSNPALHRGHLTLTNTTTVTVARAVGATNGHLTVAYQVTEYN